MVLSTCVVCRGKLATTAAACPHCGAAPSAKQAKASKEAIFASRWYVKLLSGVLTLSLLGYCASKCEGDTSEQAIAKRKAQAEATDQRAHEDRGRRLRAPLYTAEQILAEYQQDQDSAEAKYNGKLARVSGLVYHASPGSGRVTRGLLTITGPQAASTDIACLFERGSEIAHLNPGAVVTVSGVLGLRIIGSVHMSDCKVE